MLPGGKTRMYVGIGNQLTGRQPRAFYRTDDAAGAATFTDLTTTQNIGYCTGAVLVRQRRLLADRHRLTSSMWAARSTTTG